MTAPDDTASTSAERRGPLLTLPAVLAVTGAGAAVAATLASGADAKAAATQDWPPFVLVAGLLLIGFVADEDGLFAAAGHQLARLTRHGIVLFAGATLIVGVVTAVLNLDTAVAFLTPVLVYAARSRGGGEAPLLYGCLLLANAGSLFLPGSNLTNLIVLGHLHLSGGAFLSHAFAPALAALVVTAIVIATLERRSLRFRANRGTAPKAPTIGIGVVAVLAAAVLVIVLHNAALPVAGIGAVAVVVRIATGRARLARVAEVLSAPVLIGLFGIAVALGALGHAWSGPAVLLGHLDLVGTAVFAALATLLVNNLPAASLLAARTPAHPFALLIGLNLGPNLAVTGSLAWLLWLRAARAAGSRPSLRVASRLGVVAVPLSISAALGALVLSAGH